MRLSAAIYTRKSTEEGLDRDFNSLQAQREAAEAYIQSQKHRGWTFSADRYDDGGFSGGTLDRPALQQLLADMEAGQVDCVVVLDKLQEDYDAQQAARRIDAGEAPAAEQTVEIKAEPPALGGQS